MRYMRKVMAAILCFLLAGGAGVIGCMAGERRTAAAEGIPLRYDMERLLEPEKLFVVSEEGLWEALIQKKGSTEILVPEEFVRQVLEISVLFYPDGHILLQEGGSRVELTVRTMRAGEAYIPLRVICEKFGYEAHMVFGSRRVYLEDKKPYKCRKLPSSYDYRRMGRSTRVRDQGNYGTCWSFASLTALETALRPGDLREFSADHMSLHNGFSLEQREGGEYTMSMAYLLAWQGPVLEEEDPYGDGVSPEGLKPAVHVQEIQILPPKDYEAIKKAVFLNGGVQSSLYTSITGSQSRSIYYNEAANSYCYQGNQIPNHDIVITGWDDHYPRENFQTEPEGDGAFLCVSSWGEGFGDKGYFYVSYYDSNIGSNNLVYTKAEAPHNYDNIYQSDLCGWVGQVGYGKEKAYGANVYRAREQEELKAVGFYAVGDNTSYRIYLCCPADSETGFENRYMAAQGKTAYSGFYTVPVKIPAKLEPGQEFAVILEIETPGAVHPLAVEYQADEATKQADVTDGQGYISPDGIKWEPMEKRYECNLCLKAYTDRRSGTQR